MDHSQTNPFSGGVDPYIHRMREKIKIIMLSSSSCLY